VRNPLLSPRVGDRVWDPARPAFSRTVEYVSVMGTVVYSTAKAEKRTSLESWRRWGRKKNLIHELGPADSGGFPVKVHLDRQDSRELCRLRNHFLDSFPGELLPEADVLLACARVTFALLQHHSTEDSIPESLLKDAIRHELLKRVSLDG